MDPIYEQALLGQLKSIQTQPTQSFEFQNHTSVDLGVFILEKDGRRTFLGPLNAGLKLAAHALTGTAFVLTANATGGFVAAFVISADPKKNQIDLNSTFFVEPNDIGAMPSRTSTMLIPADGPRVVIEAAIHKAPRPNQAPEQMLLIREQYWRLAGSSYALAKKEKKIVEYVRRTGMEQTSSSQKTLSAELTGSASGGWGPVSASISASLSMTSSTNRSFTVTEETTVDIVEELDNSTGTEDITIFHWQLIDEVTVVKAGQPVASLAMAQAPAIHRLA